MYSSSDKPANEQLSHKKGKKRLEDNDNKAMVQEIRDDDRIAVEMGYYKSETKMTLNVMRRNKSALFALGIFTDV